jgi:hypothetical protein
MKIKLLVLLLLLAESAFADTFRVHYSIRGTGRDITVQAESSAEARRVVMDMFADAVVTGAHLVKRSTRKPDLPQAPPKFRAALAATAFFRADRYADIWERIEPAASLKALMLRWRRA